MPCQVLKTADGLLEKTCNEAGLKIFGFFVRGFALNPQLRFDENFCGERLQFVGKKLKILTNRYESDHKITILMD